MFSTNNKCLQAAPTGCSPSLHCSSQDRRQSKMLLTINERRPEIARYIVVDCQLSSVGRQLAIEISVSKDFRSTFVDSINFSIAAYPECLGGG